MSGLPLYPLTSQFCPEPMANQQEQTKTNNFIFGEENPKNVNPFLSLL